ncbi:type IV pilus biogenesis/stability protein PilW [Jeongeupia naejangsanensis]|uniref:Type IV pilus biogenesis/stability protein PilW n=1 Tax=Jeongeupia naejangsanensis TaxID=613195 RepID=A0ABS2BHA7_9NEIS|nr:type IV pilus biogenesis/stability protein PilW [Jeongeupia naejangsanensis]MBM3114845.1 type IV pilus biogenesis/stability protein PilW [Jeongeupia naejangsanensis]
MSLRSFVLLFAILLASGAALAADGDTSPDRRANVRTQLAAEYFRLGRYAVAIDEATKAIEADSKYSPAYTMLGLIYAEIKDDDKAKRNFQEALRLSPDDPDANHNYGWFLCEHGQMQEGLGYYDRALSNPLYDTPEKTALNAGQCAQKNDDNATAKRYFERALQYRPNFAPANYQLAELSLKTKDFVAAKRYALVLTKTTRPGAALTWLNLRIERGLGNADGVSRYAQELRKQYPDSLETTKLAAGQYE